MKYFMPIDRQWYMSMVYYPSRHRYSVTLLGLLVIVGFWYFALYRQFGRSISYYSHTNALLHNQIQEQEKAQESCSVIAKSIKGVERDLKAYQASPLDPNELITYVARQAINANLAIATCVLEPIVDHGWYQVQPMIVDVQGPLDVIAQWLKTVSAKSKLVTISSVSITKIDQTLARCSVTISGMCIRNII